MTYTANHKTRADYVRALMAHGAVWINSSMLNPSPSMLRKPSTITLHAVALRRLSRGDE